MINKYKGKEIFVSILKTKTIMIIQWAFLILVFFPTLTNAQNCGCTAEDYTSEFSDYITGGDFYKYLGLKVKGRYKVDIDYADINIKVQRHKFYVQNFHYIVSTNIDDSVHEARVYFRDKKSPKYQLYAQMECKQSVCHATLPISTPKLKSLRYLIVYQNAKGVLFKSKEYRSVKRDLILLPPWQKMFQEAPSKLYSEYKTVPTSVRGFDMNMEIEQTDPLDIFGVDIGLYTLEEIYPVPLNWVSPEMCERCEEKYGSLEAL